MGLVVGVGLALPRVGLALPLLYSRDVPQGTASRTLTLQMALLLECKRFGYGKPELNSPYIKARPRFIYFILIQRVCGLNGGVSVRMSQVKISIPEERIRDFCKKWNLTASHKYGSIE